MSVFTIGDLHLSFLANKPMNIFGETWENHEEKIKDNWIKKVKDEDTVILLGDFSWATYLEDTYKDFEYLNLLPGKKILSKGNHDYWWTTVSKMKKYLKESDFSNIDFLHNNAFLIDNKIITGTRGWTNAPKNSEDYRILKRENDRLEMSIKKGIQEYGEDKEIIVFIHYPPYYKEKVLEEIDFIKTMKKYNVKKCFYGHLHAESHKDAVEGNVDGIEYKLVSSDYTNFDVIKVI